MNKIRTIVKKKLIEPLLGFLKQGMTPHKLALGIALGIAIGLIPIIGITTLLGLLLSFTFRINVAVVQVVNYFIYPLQILLILPLIELGSFFLSIPAIPYSIDQILEMLNADLLLALNKLWLATLGGVFAWAILVIPVSILSYLLLKKLFLGINKRQNQSDPAEFSPVLNR